MSIDLHCHSTCSDGSATPEELITLAAKRGVTTLALTDHDTTVGIPAAQKCADALGVRLIHGVEISAADTQRGGKAHILCYAPKHPEALEPILAATIESRRGAMLESVQRVTELYPISAEMIFSRAARSTNVYKQHVLHALMDAGYADEMFGEVFYRLYDSKKGLAYRRVQYPDVYTVLDAIDAAGGVAVLAHPSEYKSMPLLRALCAEGRLSGIEVHHPRNKPEDIEEMHDLCARHGLAETGGTDFHGFYTTKKNPVGTFTTAQAEFDKLFSRKD